VDDVADVIGQEIGSLKAKGTVEIGTTNEKPGK
jgi:hypothetical protein